MAELRGPATWPDDPAYAYVTATDPELRYSGQWELYSFVPNRSVALPAPPEQENAAGASVDLAWTRTVGSPRVTVAVADTGIDWSERDLVRKVRLSRGELRSPTAAPIRADRTPCEALDPADPALDRFDCDGDGQLTIDDYGEHPDLAPHDTVPPGDANGNGRLDAQDLLAQRFIANGFDDDGNGYPDDIAGWDFVDDDNDPFDSAGVGSGTSQSIAAVASTNDGFGRAGACPACRLLPLRVSAGDAAEPQRVGQAIAYAAEQTVAVVAVPGETLGVSGHLRAAVDYAWAAGTLVITGTGGDGSRRPADPSALGRSLPVGSVGLGGLAADSTTATTFIAASSCSNFGGQRLISAPSGTCPSDAVGLVAGVAALVRSAGPSRGESVSPLSPGELRHVLLSTADDIDVLASRSETSTLAWSQPGFEQRFGHGRVNAGRAVEAAVTGRVPPEIDLVSPAPFDVLGAESATSTVNIVGTVSARRAESYDFVVDWAPGVQPEETSFRPLAAHTGLAATIVSGDGSPLARVDVRTIDPEHAADPDSPRGENAGVVTLRVRATAHYVGDDADVATELRRIVTVELDTETFAGFPRPVIGAGVAAPQLGDLNGDGLPELVVATTGGEIHVWSFASGEAVPLPGFPFRTKAHGEPRGAAYGSTAGIDPELLLEGVVAAPAIGDVDGDGDDDLVVATRVGQIYLVDGAGASPLGWPRRLPDLVRACADGCVEGGTVVARDLLSSPALADLDAAPGLEILVASFDGKVHALRRDGTAMPGWPVTIAEPDELAHLGPWGTPVTADFTGDGVPDVLTGTIRSNTGTARYVLVDGRGNAAPASIVAEWPVELTSWSLLPGAGFGPRAGAAAGDFDGDGRIDAVLQGNAIAPWIVPASPGAPNDFDTPPAHALPLRVADADARGIEYTGRFGADSIADPRLPMLPLFSLPALGDLDGDGVLDVAAAGASLDLAEKLAFGTNRDGPAQKQLALWSGRTGAMLPGSPMVLEGLTWLGGAAIVDLTGDDYPEVIVGTDGNLVHALDACGREAAGWPKRTGQWVAAAPAVADLDGDGTLEVAVATRAGWIHLWHTTARADSVSPWPVQHHDSGNSGATSTPLPGRRAVGPVVPLPLDAEGRCVPPQEENAATAQMTLVPRGGGCACDLGVGSPSVRVWWAIPLALALSRRRRDRRAQHRTGAGLPLSWWRRSDLNRRHRAYEARALTG